MNTTGPVTLQDVRRLAIILNWCQDQAHVRWICKPEVPRTIEGGTVRGIGDENGNFLCGDEEIRTAYVRITTDSGWEWFAPVAEIVDLLYASEIAADLR